MILPFLVTLLFETDATIYVGGLDEKVTETLLWELFLQGGPVGKCPKYSTFGMLIHFDEQFIKTNRQSFEIS